MRLPHLAMMCLGLALGHGAAAQGAEDMTPQAARGWLRGHGIDPLPDNVPQQILTGNADALDALIAAGVDINKKTEPAAVTAGTRIHVVFWRPDPAGGNRADGRLPDQGGCRRELAGDGRAHAADDRGAGVHRLPC